MRPVVITAGVSLSLSGLLSTEERGRSGTRIAGAAVRRDARLESARSGRGGGPRRTRSPGRPCGGGTRLGRRGVAPDPAARPPRRRRRGARRAGALAADRHWLGAGDRSYLGVHLALAGDGAPGAAARGAVAWA